MFNLQSGLTRQKFPAPVTPQQAKQIREQLTAATDIATAKPADGRKFWPGTGKHTKAVTGLIVDQMNKNVVSCSRDGTVKFWDFLTGALTDEIDWAPMTAPTLVRYHPGSSLLAFACQAPSGDASVRIVDMETKRTIRELLGGDHSINDLCFSHDGRWIIAASADSVIRIWDLPTSHLIDAIRLEEPCKAVAMSSTGEYLAATLETGLGVMLWTNKSLYKHVPTRQISEKEVATVDGPTLSGEGNQGMLEGAYEEQGDDQEDPNVVAPNIEQLSSDMTTLSLVPKSRWQTLLHLDMIKERNKPTEAPKAPEKAPFFLPSANGSAKDAKDEKPAAGTEVDGKSRITTLDNARFEELFATKLRVAAESGNCKSCLGCCKYGH
jgi:U3 small nucleolar RNA-associated protein 21